MTCLVSDASNLVLDCCLKMNKVCGTHVIDPNDESIRAAISLGYRFLALASDVFVLQKWRKDTHELIRRFHD